MTKLYEGRSCITECKLIDRDDCALFSFVEEESARLQILVVSVFIPGQDSTIFSMTRYLLFEILRQFHAQNGQSEERIFLQLDSRGM